ncbi:MAG TPA: XRE family transcriptional regulator [Steroidobacter sp.]|uniref:helix-turn-helix domain-containing protein n=1 Tax=Steroidobacter sp. TaxID=1978227 RepID=UPI002ED83A19
MPAPSNGARIKRGAARQGNVIPKSSTKKSSRSARKPAPARAGASGRDYGNVQAIAQRIRSIRKRKHISLDALAAKVSLDKGYLSRIERGEKAPSVATLLNIAAALDLQVAQLFGETTTADAITVVRAKEHVQMQANREDAAASYEAILPASANRRMSLFMIDPSHLAPMEKVGHPGDELIYVISGTIDVVFADRTVTLAAGDTVHFPGDVRHQIRRVGTQSARALVIVANDLADARKLNGERK